MLTSWVIPFVERPRASQTTAPTALRIVLVSSPSGLSSIILARTVGSERLSASRNLDFWAD
jgi:hypothetical protein